jgi:LPS sulfotransferase NodH
LEKTISQYLCLVAGQRAGTTALQDALGSTGKFLNFSEIFHTEPPNMRGTFLDFCITRDIRVADMATETRTQEIALDYLNHLRELAGTKVPLLDIKLNSWHVIKPFWSYVHQTPFFMKVLLKNEALFLFIRRRNIVDQILSEHIARSAEKWHGLEEGDIDGQIEINPALVAGQARLILQSELFLSGCLRSSNRMVAIDYEDLYQDGFVNPNLLSVLQSRLGVSLPSALKPSIQRNAPDKRQIVANYDEVSQAINDVLKRFPREKIANQITE